MALTSLTYNGSDERTERTPDLVLLKPVDDLPSARRVTGVRAIRVVIADGQPVVRAGLRALLGGQKDITVVGDASHGDEAVSLVQEVHPDVVLIDGDIPRRDVLEVTREIVDHPERAGIRVMLLATHDADEFLFASLRAGASGFVTKDTEPADLIEAVRVVAGGRRYSHPAPPSV